MPLYNQATNLQGRGNFAPGVKYYAGIKAPKQPDVTLPKATGGFNIDLSQIGNAMIAAKESETKLGMAAIEMEQDLQQAEKERQFRLELTKMEQEGQDRRLDKELATRWQIESMKNDTELLKIKKQKEAEEKDYRLEQAGDELIRNEKLKQAYIDYQNDPSSNELNFQLVRNEVLADIARKHNVKVSNLQTIANNAYSYGSGINYELAKTESKKYQEEGFNVTKSIAQTAFPDLYSNNPEAAMQSATNLQTSIAAVKQWKQIEAENGNDNPHISAWARNQIDSNIKNIALETILDNMKATKNAIRNVEDPAIFVDRQKAIATQSIASITGLSTGEVRPIVDGVYATSNIDATINDIYTRSEGSSKLQDNLFNAAIKSGRREMLENGSAPLQAMITLGNLPVFNALPKVTQENVALIVASELFGSTRPYADEDGTRGQIFTYRNQSIKLTDAELNDISQQLGLDIKKPDQVALIYGSQMLKNNRLNSQISNEEISYKDAGEVWHNTVRLATGNNDPDLKLYNVSVNDLDQLQKNVMNNCNVDKICPVENILKSIPYKKGTPEYDDALTIGNSLMATRRLGTFYNETQMTKINQDLNYVSHPVNITGKDVAKFKGEDYNKDPDKWDNYSLKDTVISYKIDGDIVKLNYYQNGWFKTGGTELGKKLDNLEQVMSNAKVPVEEQVAYYKKMIPNIVEDSTVEKSITREIGTKAQEFTLDTAAKADTKLASSLAGSEIGDDFIEYATEELVKSAEEINTKDMTKRLILMTDIGKAAAVAKAIKNIPEDKMNLQSFNKFAIDLIQSGDNKLRRIGNIIKEPIDRVRKSEGWKATKQFFNDISDAILESFDIVDNE